MAVQIAVGTPLAEALNSAVHTKLLEVGWGSEDDTSLAEFIVLMLVNGKTEGQIASELASDILPEGEGTQEFARWLFEQVRMLQNGGSASATKSQAEQQSIPSFQDPDESRRSKGDTQDAPVAYDSEMVDGSATAPGNASVIDFLSFVSTLTSPGLLDPKPLEMEAHLAEGQDSWDKLVEPWTDQTSRSSTEFGNSLAQKG